jgi:hypothetical protein
VLPIRRASVLGLLLPAVICAAAVTFAFRYQAQDAAGTRQPPSSFASYVAALSEPGGYFDTDNLISNERSYLQVLPELRHAGVRGGAYIGVGPDTSFSYIAEVRPTIAFIVDIRRDNLLLHLLFKALFEMSATRAEYLGHLLGRAPPAGDGWRTAPIDRIVRHFADAPARAIPADVQRRITTAIRRTGVTLSAEDLETISAFHQRFVEAGLSLRFTSTGRPPQYHYPTYRDLLLETDSEGRQANYLATDEAFQFVKSLQARDLIVPIVGDLSGPTAVAGIGRELARRGERMSVFYTSNVEFYLYGQGTHAQFLANLQQIPRTPRSVVIRSVFGRYISGGRPGDGSTSQVHTVQALLDGAAQGRFRSYGQLVAKGGG